ncbi:MAG: Coenzyme F420 hydrogenase/dehydrogenase, beta subunit C-terminal domain, partial [Methanosphaera sp.]|nr:Coenzyme F420 hydrogenase/dehydrogenase, beta subunit C-terminal domain [Methanosphaera sp.]
GAKPGWSTVIKRTDKGVSLIDSAIEDGVLEVTETNEGKFGLEMLRKLSTNKKKQRVKNVDKALDLGLQVPFTRSDLKEDILENK